MLVKKPMIQQWNQRGNQKIPQHNKQCKNKHTKSIGCKKSNPKRNIHSNKKKKEKSQINNLTYHLKEWEKEQTKPKVKVFT